MAVKTTGAEFKRFYNDPEFWPKDSGYWHEDEEVTINGVFQDEHAVSLEEVADDAQMTIAGGVVLGLDNDEDPSLETYFKRWRKKQTTASFVVECDKSNVDVVKTVIRAAGGRVV